MGAKSRRKSAASRSEGLRQRPIRRAAGRPLTLPLLVLAGGIAVAGVVAVLAFRPQDTGGADPSPWARLDTADVHALAFGPEDPAHLYFGHHDGLLESRDGGRSWQPTSLSGTDAMNVRISGEGRIQIAGHEVYVESTDGGATWQPVPNDLPGIDLHALALDPADAEHAWTFAVGFGLFETRDGGRHWELRQPGNWGSLAAYRSGVQIALVAVGPEGLVRSLDGGGTWDALAYPGAPLAGGIAAAADGSVLYAATTDGLRRSADQGQSWPETGFDGIALAVAVAPGDRMGVAVVDDGTRFYRSPDGGASWPPP
jgi:photosystem II stability/assembly factor-like uncharacterized protein